LTTWRCTNQFLDSSSLLLFMFATK
jgi:hypothetical protein